MEKEFVPYELALRLKDLGFYCDCFGDYFKFVNFFNQDPFLVTDDNRYRIEEDNEEEDILRVSAPTFSQAFRWFREKYDLRVCIESDGTSTFDYTIKTSNAIFSNMVFEDDLIYRTYEKAELACLDKLMEIVEQKQN